MRIDGITTCVGPLYAGYLAKTLDAWRLTLESITIIGDGSDNGLEIKTWGASMKFIETDAFTRHGEHFNKGRALNEGIAAAKPTDWILAFDCDILPPADWRQIAEQHAQRGNLYSARRYQPDGRPTDRRWYPRGFFQLWHASDNRRFPEHYPDAGGYDTEFVGQWARYHWRELPIKLMHLGDKAKHWCGPNGTEQENEAARKRGIDRQRRRISQAMG